MSAGGACIRQLARREGPIDLERVFRKDSAIAMFQELQPALGLSVSDAAKQLGINEARTRSLIEAGVLDAVKVGARWIVDPVSVERRRRLSPPPGRQFSPDRALGLLMLAAKEPAPWLDRVAEWKLRRELARSRLKLLAPRLKERAEVLRLRAHPAALRRIAGEPQVVRSGPSAASELGLEISAPDVLEAYVPAKQLAKLARKYRLGLSRDPNVILHVVAGSWPFGSDRRVVPLSFAAMDLLESDDPRARRAGIAVLQRLDSR